MTEDGVRIAVNTAIVRTAVLLRTDHALDCYDVLRIDVVCPDKSGDTAHYGCLWRRLHDRMMLRPSGVNGSSALRVSLVILPGLLSCFCLEPKSGLQGPAMNLSYDETCQHAAIAASDSPAATGQHSRSCFTRISTDVPDASLKL